MSYVLLDDGRRQILHFLFPGELVCLSSIAFEKAPETVSAVTDCIVCPFERGALSVLIRSQPRLAALLMVQSQIERVALTDRVAGLGRTSARARVAALLLELRNRYRMVDDTVENSFPLPITQEEIGDAIGLTAVHVNRMLRQLEEELLIAREAGRVVVTDEPGLIHAANYVGRHEKLDLSWLPPARD